MFQRHNFANWSMASVKDWMSTKRKTDKLALKEAASSSDLISESQEEDGLIKEKDSKTGKIKFQRNVPGEPTIYDGHIIGQLKDVKKTKKGMINFHNWEMVRQAVLLCPSVKKGLMPLKKELQFIFPRAVYGVDVHGGFIAVARKLGLKAHRVAPFYIPYLEPDEQYEFIQSEIDKYNEVRAKQKKMF